MGNGTSDDPEGMVVVLVVEIEGESDVGLGDDAKSGRVAAC